MYLIRDVFQCKPGKSRALAEKFKSLNAVLAKEKLLTNGRVLIDFVANYWTVVLEGEVENLGQFDEQMAKYGSRQDIQKIMEGYMDMVEGGRREIFRIA